MKHFEHQFEHWDYNHQLIKKNQKKPKDKEILHAEALRMLADLCRMQGEIMQLMLTQGYVPERFSDIVSFTEAISDMATSLTSLMEAQTQIMLMKADLDKI